MKVYSTFFHDRLDAEVMQSIVPAICCRTPPLLQKKQESFEASSMI